MSFRLKPKHLFVSLILFTSLFLSSCSLVDHAKSWFINPTANSTQMLLVLAKDWNSTENMYGYMQEGVYLHGIVINHNYKKPILVQLPEKIFYKFEKRWNLPKANHFRLKGFVYLKKVDPTILQDIRYATDHNFIGS